MDVVDAVGVVAVVVAVGVIVVVVVPRPGEEWVVIDPLVMGSECVGRSVDLPPPRFASGHERVRWQGWL